MKIVVVTIRVPGNPTYDKFTARWLDSYIKFKPAIPHELVVVDSDVAAPPGKHGEHTDRFMVYTGGGWDCGIWQMVGREIDADLLVCCNTSTHYMHAGWLGRFAEAVGQYGPGLYGPLASLSFYPHIRTPCMVFSPEVIRGYPNVVDSRQKTYGFECLAGPDNFTLWCDRNGYPPRMVTWDGCYEMGEWREPENVFWKGDQSNLVVKDRHADRYDFAGELEKDRMTKEANGPSL